MVYLGRILYNITTPFHHDFKNIIPDWLKIMMVEQTSCQNKTIRIFAISHDSGCEQVYFGNRFIILFLNISFN